jgi:hypothetical protein
MNILILWLKRLLIGYLMVAVLYMLALIVLHRSEFRRPAFALRVVETAATWPYVLVRDGRVRRR